jgi:pimeloyl-ACP methyl ester carboxylesterase
MYEGSGSRVAALIHGFTPDSTTWWQLGPTLADHGYTVLAPDLPGHGRSPRCDTYTLDTMAAALIEALPTRPALAIGHSLGGLLLAKIVDHLAAERVVYEDPAWSPSHPTMTEMFRAQKHWDLQQVSAAAPRWAPQAHFGKLESLHRWDIATSDIMDNFPGLRPHAPTAPSLVLVADPSPVVSPPLAIELADLGYEVRTVPGTGHVIHNDDYTEFLTQLQDTIRA